MQANEHIIEYTTEESTVLGQMFSQTYNLTKGIYNFGDKGLYATLAEVKQPHDRTCFWPIDVNKLTSQERKRAMESLIFLTENCDGGIKGQSCTNWSVQRYWINKEWISSPKIVLESVIMLI